METPGRVFLSGGELPADWQISLQFWALDTEYLLMGIFYVSSLRGRSL